MARSFGATWWGLAWLDALEGGAMADAARLGRGRTYARQGRVEIVEVLPGSVLATVTGSDDYRADLSIRQLTDEAWESIVDAVAGRSRHAGALLAGELPTDLQAELQTLGIELLPQAGEVLGDCSCPDWGEPCKHVAALCYLIADLIDRDPFTLFLLRGRSRNDLLEGIRQQRRRASALLSIDLTDDSDRRSSPPSEEGVDAEAAYGRLPAPIPAPVSTRSARAVRLATRPPVDSGIELEDLSRLTADAARRARLILDGRPASGLRLTLEEDVARRIAVAPGDVDQLRQFSHSLGRSEAELAAWAIAWRQGGAEGLDVARSTWRPSSEQLAPARRLIGERARVVGNAVSGGGVQLRLDEAGRWWRFAAHVTLGWVLASPGFVDPADALDPTSSS